MFPEQLRPCSFSFSSSFILNSGAPWLVKVDRGLGLASGSESKGTSSASDFQGESSPCGVALADRGLIWSTTA